MNRALSAQMVCGQLETPNARVQVGRTGPYEKLVLATVTIGQGASFLIQSSMAATSASFNLDPMGILSPSWRMAFTSKLFPGWPRTMEGPRLPPFSNASRLSTRSEDCC